MVLRKEIFDESHDERAVRDKIADGPFVAYRHGVNRMISWSLRDLLLDDVEFACRLDVCTIEGDLKGSLPEEHL